MREKFYRFMQGRYGQDQLSRFLLILDLIFLIANIFLRSSQIRGKSALSEGHGQIPLLVRPAEKTG